MQFFGSFLVLMRFVLEYLFWNTCSGILVWEVREGVGTGGKRCEWEELGMG